MAPFLQQALLLGLLVPLASCLQLGTGIYDTTSSISDVLMMGMANPKQKSAGLHQRLRSRAFVAWDESTDKRFAFVSLDSGMGSDVLNNRVIAELEKRLPGLYSHKNVAISGTHTHSGPSGFLQNVLYQFAGSGWVPATMESFVTGVVESIVMAHEDLRPAKASVAVAALAKANINRSPTSYLRNPQQERDQYEHDTDHNMTMLKLEATDGSPLGSFSWFAVHGTSMNNTNLLVSGDNKGYASYLMEKLKNGNSAAPGLGKYVAGFPSTNLGDVSPNTAGPKCRDTGLPCDTNHSTCNGRNEMCSSFGPGKDMFESCEIIGRKQYDQAVLLDKALHMNVGGAVDSALVYVKMPGLSISSIPNARLCKAAVGDSFAAGTTDGPGAFDFTQGANSSNPLWNFIVDLVHKSTPEERACQEPKGILLPTGGLNVPWAWAPDTLAMQILRLGDFVILSVPTEMTTMAGRRLRDTVKAQMVADGLVTAKAVVVIAGLANGYADYTVTFEEYQAQRYEASSTIYGPHQLSAYIQELSKLAHGMATGSLPQGDAAPVDFSDKLINTGPRLSTDYFPNAYFGQVLLDVQPSYHTGDVVEVEFAGTNAQNNLRAQGSFLQVQLCTSGRAVPEQVVERGSCPTCSCSSPSIWPVSGCDVECGAKCGDTCCCIAGVGSCRSPPPPPAPSSCTAWRTVAVDSDWETRIHIKKQTFAVVKTARTWVMSWHVPAEAAAGKYRIVYTGTACDKPLVGKASFSEFVGKSGEFEIA